MIDGIKVENLGVAAEVLLGNPQLQFLGKFDQATGAVIEEGKDSLLVANYHGLNFTAIRGKRSGQLRIELKGSLHKYHNGGLHNANDFEAQHLLRAIDELVHRFGVDPFASRLNNVEFGVNVWLPFPAQSVLDALICYKGKPFVPGQDGPVYYQCASQRYLVKVYNKGRQCNLGENLLRFEIKVARMEYLTRQGIGLAYLSDLTAVALYPLLGELLAATFAEILFNEPSIDSDDLTSGKERELLLKGRDARYWQTDKDRSGINQQTLYKQLQRDDKRFRDLLSRYRVGDDWQATTAALIRAKWQQLTALPDPLLAQISNHRGHWQNGQAATNYPQSTGVLTMNESTECSVLTGVKPEQIASAEDENQPRKCPELTGVNPPKEAAEEARTCSVLTGVVASQTDPKKGADFPEKCPLLTGVQKGQMSTINHNSLVLIVDNHANSSSAAPAALKPQKKAVRKGKKAPKKLPLFDAPEEPSGERGKAIHLPPPSRPLTITQLREEPALLNQLQQQHGRHKRKRQRHDETYYQAHNSRNQESNPRNNLRRRLQRILDNPGMFPTEEVIKLTAQQKSLLDHWQGTPYQVVINRPAANQ